MSMPSLAALASTREEQIVLYSGVELQEEASFDGGNAPNEELPTTLGFPIAETNL
jgi:hypothetical protein